MFSEYEIEILDQASSILLAKLHAPKDILTNPSLVRDFLSCHLAPREHEVFAVLFLDFKNQLIEFQELFRGTIGSASVYPREVVKEALALNTARVIVAHNHPSGSAEPSQADRRITLRLSEALALVDIQVLDHIVIGHGELISFAERGWI